MPAPNFQNRTLFHSDNLPILQGMNSETVDLIATDPPFNKGRDFHIHARQPVARRPLPRPLVVGERRT